VVSRAAQYFSGFHSSSNRASDSSGDFHCRNPQFLPPPHVRGAAAGFFPRLVSLIEDRHGNDFADPALLYTFLKHACTGMRIEPAQLAARYRGYAAQCLVVAQRQDNCSDKLTLIKMAQAWVVLAEQTGREQTGREQTGARTDSTRRTGP
jgi:hypothetical protein